MMLYKSWTKNATSGSAAGGGGVAAWRKQHKSLRPCWNPRSKNRVASSNDISSFPQVVFWQSYLGQCIKSANYMLAKLNSYVELFSCPSYAWLHSFCMYQVRYEMTKYGQKHCKTTNNTLYVFFLNMFTQVTSAAVSFLTHLHLSSKHGLACRTAWGSVASKFCTKITTNLSVDLVC